MHYVLVTLLLHINQSSGLKPSLKLKSPTVGSCPHLVRGCQAALCRTGWVKVLHPKPHKIGQFRDVLPSQSFGLVLRNSAETIQFTPRESVMCINRDTT